MPDEGNGNRAVGDRGKRKPDDHDNLEFLEVHKLGNHAHRNRSAESSTYEKYLALFIRVRDVLTELTDGTDCNDSHSGDTVREDLHSPREEELYQASDNGLQNSEQEIIMTGIVRCLSKSN